MPSSNKAMTGSPILTPGVSTANAILTITVTAPTSTSQQIFLYGYMFSAQAAPAAPVAVTITGLAGGTITHEVPASAFAPIVVLFGTHPLRATVGQSIVLTVPALGGTTISSGFLLTEVDGAP